MTEEFMDKNEFIRETSRQLLAAYLIEDRIAWMKDIECFGCDIDTLVSSSIDVSERLWKELAEKGYTESEPEEEPPISTTAFPEYSHTLDPEIREAIVAIFD